MILILEVTSSAKPAVSRQTFSGVGGSIGRDRDNSWVLPHSKVSGHHALISYRNGVFYIEDTSRNGVCLNSSKNRLARGQPYGLKSGDRILIDPYEIGVSVAQDRDETSGRDEGDFRALRSSNVEFDANPFDEVDPFAPSLVPSAGLESPGELIADKELDPLELLNLAPKHAPPAKNVPNARDLQRGSLLDAHFQPPAVVPSPAPSPPPRQDAGAIPLGYDPLADSGSARIPSFPMPEPVPEPRPQRPIEPQTPPPPVVPVHQVAPPVAPMPVRPVSRPPEPDPEPIRARRPVEASPDHPGADLAAVLAGAGLDPDLVTPELAQTFGRILRVVVSGVMDVMRSRQQIKDEFRMRMTRFRVAENNPLKFSANVDDALHNLLVKRNPAYLPPVEAFEDAFDDLRDHQIAMLAGMRVAFESMLAEFDPERLQMDFDRQLGKGMVPAKLRYWDLYRERRHDIVKDPEASFRRLFGDEFAKAYEEQLTQLKGKKSGGRES